MVALLLYGYCQGERSSRVIEQRCLRDVAYRVICGGLHPDHATVARFRARHETALGGCSTRFWVLPRPTVAAAATLIAPAARLARAIADRTRAGFRSGSALGLAGTGRDTGLVSLHRISADIFPSPFPPAGFSLDRYYRRDGDREFPRSATADQSRYLD